MLEHVFGLHRAAMEKYLLANGCLVDSPGGLSTAARVLGLTLAADQRFDAAVGSLCVALQEVFLGLHKPFGDSKRAQLPVVF